METAEHSPRAEPLTGNPKPGARNVLPRLWPWLAAAASGMLVALCFPRFDQPWLCWIALTPLICAVWFSPRPVRRAWARNARLGYVAGIAFFTTTFHWLGELGPLFGTLWLRGLPLLLSLYLAVYFAFWAWFIGLLRPNAEPASFLRSRENLRVAFLGACAWVTHEWVRGWLFSGFGWNALGVALHGNLPMIQVVQFTGVAGLSFLVAFCNLMAVQIIRRIIAELGPLFLKRIRWEFSITMGMVLAVFAFGVRTLVKPPPDRGASVRIAAIQPNIPQTEHFEAERDGGHAEQRILDQLDRLTSLAATTNPQLVLWPEAAMPRGIFASEENYQFTLQQTTRGNFALLIGTMDAEPELNEEYNAAALITPGERVPQIYRKTHLVPFGEYMPLRHSFPLFAMVAGELVPGDLAPGRECTVLQLRRPPLRPVRIGALICFEDTVADVARCFVQKEAQLLVNLTNDGWFGRSAAAEQQLANALFRSVENRRPLVRCANTGMTASVDSLGRVTVWLKPFQQGFQSREITVPGTLVTTFYTRHGDAFTYCASIVTVSAVLICAARARAARKRSR